MEEAMAQAQAAQRQAVSEAVAMTETSAASHLKVCLAELRKEHEATLGPAVAEAERSATEAEAARGRLTLAQALDQAHERQERLLEEQLTRLTESANAERNAFLTARDEDVIRAVEQARAELTVTGLAHSKVESDELRRSLAEEYGREAAALRADLEERRQRELAAAAESAQKAVRLAIANAEKDNAPALERQADELRQEARQALALTIVEAEAKAAKDQTEAIATALADYKCMASQAGGELYELRTKYEQRLAVQQAAHDQVTADLEARWAKRLDDELRVAISNDESTQQMAIDAAVDAAVERAQREATGATLRKIAEAESRTAQATRALVEQEAASRALVATEEACRRAVQAAEEKASARQEHAIKVNDAAWAERMENAIKAAVASRDRTAAETIAATVTAEVQEAEMAAEARTAEALDRQAASGEALHAKELEQRLHEVREASEAAARLALAEERREAASAQAAAVHEAVRAAEERAKAHAEKEKATAVEHAVRASRVQMEADHQMALDTAAYAAEIERKEAVCRVEEKAAREALTSVSRGAEAGTEAAVGAAVAAAKREAELHAQHRLTEAVRQAKVEAAVEATRASSLAAAQIAELQAELQAARRGERSSTPMGPRPTTPTLTPPPPPPAEPQPVASPLQPALAERVLAAEDLDELQQAAKAQLTAEREAERRATLLEEAACEAVEAEKVEAIKAAVASTLHKERRRADVAAGEPFSSCPTEENYVL